MFFNSALVNSIAAAMIVTSLWTVPATAQNNEDFYKGRTIRLLIGFGPGGGYDLYARTLARHMGRHIPGNHLANAAPRDGTVIGAFASGVPSVPLLTPDQAKFDAATLNWIGSANNEVQIDYVWHSSPATTLDAVRNTEVILGPQGLEPLPSTSL
jgi:hypothetical protein